MSIRERIKLKSDAHLARILAEAEKKSLDVTTYAIREFFLGLAKPTIAVVIMIVIVWLIYK